MSNNWIACPVSSVINQYLEMDSFIAEYHLLGLESSRSPEFAQTVYIGGYKGQGEKTVVIPSEIHNRDVTVIGKDAFRGRHDSRYPAGYITNENGEYCDMVKNFEITNIVLPEGIRHIQMGAFIALRNLSSINLPDSLVWLGEYCLARTNITKIKIPSNVKKVQDSSFWLCEKLSEVDLGNVQQIAENAFCDCTSLKTLAFPPTIKKMDDGAFFHAGLKYISFAQGPSEINMGAFEGCNELKACYIPRSVNKITKSKDITEKHIAFFVYRNSYAHFWATKNHYRVISINE